MNLTNKKTLTSGTEMILRKRTLTSQFIWNRKPSYSTIQQKAFTNKRCCHQIWALL